MSKFGEYSQKRLANVGKSGESQIFSKKAILVNASTRQNLLKLPNFEMTLFCTLYIRQGISLYYIFIYISVIGGEGKPR